MMRYLLYVVRSDRDDTIHHIEIQNDIPERHMRAMLKEMIGDTRTVIAATLYKVSAEYKIHTQLLSEKEETA